MSNYYDTVVRNAEAALLANGRRSPLPKRNVNTEDVTSIYIMLNGGLVVDTSNNPFNKTQVDAYINDAENGVLDSLRLPESQPNKRFLNAFSDFLTARGIKHFRSTLAIKPGKQRVVQWHINESKSFQPTKVMLSSFPVFGIPYYKVTVFRFSRCSMNETHDLHAETPLILFHKLLNRGLITNTKGGLL